MSGAISSSSRSSGRRLARILVRASILALVVGAFAAPQRTGWRETTRRLVVAVDRSPRRLDVARQLGAHTTIEADGNIEMTASGDLTAAGNNVTAEAGASAAVSGALTMLDYAAAVHLISDALEVTDALEKQLKGRQKKEKGDNHKGGDQNRYQPFIPSI